MTSKEFTNQLYKNTQEDYGVFPPHTEAQQGLNILIEHFLGEDYFTYLHRHNTEQINSEAIREILKRYPKEHENRYTLPEYINYLNNK